MTTPYAYLYNMDAGRLVLDIIGLPDEEAYEAGHHAPYNQTAATEAEMQEIVDHARGGGYAVFGWPEPPVYTYNPDTQVLGKMTAGRVQPVCWATHYGAEAPAHRRNTLGLFRGDLSDEEPEPLSEKWLPVTGRAPQFFVRI